MVYFALSFGDIDQKFYQNIATLYDQAVALIIKHDERPDFIEWCYELMKSSQDIGWGFGFAMEEIYTDAFGQLEEDRPIT